MNYDSAHLNHFLLTLNLFSDNHYLHYCMYDKR